MISAIRIPFMQLAQAQSIKLAASKRRQIVYAKVITDMAELEQLTTCPIVLLNQSPIRLELPDMGGRQQDYWQNSINRHLTECGCRQARIVILASVALFIAYLALSPAAQTMTLSGKLEVGLPIVILTGVLGKMAALLRARLLLNKTIRQLKATVESSAYFENVMQNRQAR